MIAIAPAHLLCPICGRLKPQPKPRRSLWDLIRMAAGDLLLDSAGRVKLNASGQEMLDNGSGNTCCCCAVFLTTPNCPSTTGAKNFTGVISGHNFWSGCINDIFGGSEAWIAGSPTGINGSHNFSGSSGVASWGGGSLGGGSWNYGVYTGTGCSTFNHNAIGTLNATLVRDTATSYYAFITVDLFAVFYGQLAGASDCTSDFSITNSFGSIGSLGTTFTLGANSYTVGGYGGVINFTCA